MIEKLKIVAAYVYAAAMFSLIYLALFAWGGWVDP